MKLWLTKTLGARYILTRLRPVIARVLGSRDRDVYERYGEPFARGNTYCEAGIFKQFGVRLKALQSVRVEVPKGRVIA